MEKQKKKEKFSTQFFVNKSKYSGCDAYDNKGGDRTPDGVRFGELPDRQDA